MSCHICGEEAVERCYTCGQLFCDQHGGRDCLRCQTGVMEGDPRPDRISASLVSRSAKPGWWRSQQAEDFDPPACYACRGLARQTCRNCQSLYCPEHKGKNELCAACERSSRLGAYVFVGAVGSVALLILIGRFVW